MTLERSVMIEGKKFGVTISDDQQALRSAYAEGRAVVGLWHKEENQSLAPAVYVVEHLQDADAAFLDRVARRRLGLPWIIGESERLVIREFTIEDVYKIPKERVPGSDDAVFYEKSSLEAYIRFQYGFYEYGIWALEDKTTGRLVGKAGITSLDSRGEDWISEAVKKNDTPMELGYHIFSSFRRQGYGKEACKAILAYAGEHISETIYALIEGGNFPSRSLAKGLGFRPIAHTNSGSAVHLHLYEWNC